MTSTSNADIKTAPKPIVIKRRSQRTPKIRIARRLTQLAVSAFIIFAAARHQLLEGSDVTTPSIDALCPFGGVETLYTWATTGKLVSKTHPSDLVLLLGVVIGGILAGNAFCGWLCPFGAFQDALTWVRRKLHLPTVHLCKRVDKVLRYGRYVTLALILYMTISSAKLWFADYDPYRTLFGLGWLFAFDFSAMWIGLLILAVVVVASLLVERAWCRYLCPLGGTFALLNHLSFLRIRRSVDSCRDCDLCNKPCPVGIDVSHADPAIGTDCIACMECVEACGRRGALSVQLKPTWVDGVQKLIGRPSLAADEPETCELGDACAGCTSADNCSLKDERQLVNLGPTHGHDHSPSH